MKINCQFCSKEFNKTPADIKRSINHYCSNQCYQNKRKSEWIDNCISCNKFIKTSSKRKRRHRYFCRSCAIKDLYKRNPESREKYNKHHKDYNRIKNGKPLEVELKRPDGSGYISKTDGYVYLCKKEYRIHPNANKRGVICEHTIIMTNHLKRPLHQGENVHHKNGVRDDNRLENLELWSRNQPAGQRVEDKITFYKDFLEQYGAKVDLSTISEKVYNQKS